MPALAKRVDKFSETDVDDEIVVMRLDSGEFFSLSGTSAAIWRLLDGQRDRSGVIAALIAEFDGDDRTVAADVDAFLAKLREMNLLASE